MGYSKKQRFAQKEGSVFVKNDKKENRRQEKNRSALTKQGKCDILFIRILKVYQKSCLFPDSRRKQQKGRVEWLKVFYRLQKIWRRN